MVNTIVAGGVAALMAWPAGPWLAVPVALVAMLAHFGLWVLHGRKNYSTSTDPKWVRFPTSDGDVS